MKYLSVTLKLHIAMALLWPDLISLQIILSGDENQYRPFSNEVCRMTSFKVHLSNLV